MKKAEEYIVEIGDGLYMAYSVRDKNHELTPVMSVENAKKAIKKAQEDAIRETAEACADEAWAYHYMSDYACYFGVDKESVMEVAKKLIKEL